MKKHCLSLPGTRPSAPKSTRVILLVATVFLAQAALGPRLYAGAGDVSRVRRLDRSAHSYLPVLGPAPLRIQKSNAPLPTLVLPPLAMEDPPPVQPMASPTTNNPVVKKGATSLPTVKATADSAPPPLELVNPPGEPMFSFGTAAPIITPQMLVRFFKAVGSNHLGGAWSVPVFVPPSPPPSKSSTATYQSP